jgi:hypothetical protein
MNIVNIVIAIIIIIIIITLFVCLLLGINVVSPPVLTLH